MTKTADSHLRCIDALPAYLDGSLDAGEVAWLVSHTCTCDRCREELVLARRLRVHYQQEWSSIAQLIDPDYEQAEFDRLWTRVAASNAVPPQVVPLRQHWRWRKTLPAALAATLLFGIAGAWYRNAETPAFRTLADDAPRSCRALRIELSAATPALQQVLDATGARVISASRLDHVYVISTPNPAKTLRQLRALPTVERAESTDC